MIVIQKNVWKSVSTFSYITSFIRRATRAGKLGPAGGRLALRAITRSSSEGVLWPLFGEQNYQEDLQKKWSINNARFAIGFVSTDACKTTLHLTAFPTIFRAFTTVFEEIRHFRNFRHFEILRDFTFLRFYVFEILRFWDFTTKTHRTAQRTTKIARMAPRRVLHHHRTTKTARSKSFKRGHIHTHIHSFPSIIISMDSSIFVK